MTVWHLYNEDCSGIFTTKEKALQSLKNFINRVKAYDYTIKDHDTWIEVSNLKFVTNDGEPDEFVITRDDIYIQSYELDEDYN